MGKISKWAIVMPVIIIISLFWYGATVSKSQQRQQTSREVALTCTTDMATQFHIHPNLKILINGEDIFIPANIGVRSECMTSIHTHEGGGLIHVEAPVKKDFTLGDFFAVWEKDFSSARILDAIANESSIITVTVNGVRVDTYENTIMYDNDDIIIEYKDR